MIEHPTPQMVAITGSVRAGMEVARAAASDLKRVHLELGGKAPGHRVRGRRPPRRRPRASSPPAYFNAGQDCTAATRVLVHEAVHDEFVAALAAHVRSERAHRRPHDEDDVLYGPLNNANQLEHVSGIIDRAARARRIAAGGDAQGEPRLLLRGHVVTGLRQDDEAVQSEIFGPVLTVQKFRDEAQALAMGERRRVRPRVDPSGRATTARAMRFAKHLDFGCVWINTHIPIVAEMPHGGFKHSGYGKDLSNYGFEDYTRIKHVMSRIG